MRGVSARPYAHDTSKVQKFSILSKTQQNRAVLLRKRLTTLWRSEIHMNFKTDADALNRRRRRFCVCRSI